MIKLGLKLLFFAAKAQKYILYFCIFVQLVSRILLPFKSSHNNHDIFYDEMVLIFFMNTIAKLHVKKLCNTLELHTACITNTITF